MGISTSCGGRLSVMIRRTAMRLLLMGGITIVGPIAGARAADLPPPKSAKYYEVLVRRPAPGYLFDRFYNAWLDESTVEELEKFLSERAVAGESSDGLMLAFYYAKQGDDLRSLAQFGKTLSQDPGNAAAWYEKAIVEARTLDFDTALADLQRAIESQPDDKLAVQVAKLRGKLLVRNRQRGEAIEAWNKLLVDHPSDEELAEDVIELQIEEGLFDEAAALSRELVERTKDPYKRVLRELRLGDALDRGSKRQEAIATYRAALARVGAESWLEREILAQIERVFRREDDLAGLQKEYASLVEEQPQRVGFHRAYARVLSEAGDARGAIEKFQEILKLTPGDRANQEAFIELHVKAADIPGATKHLQALIAQHPQDGELLVQLSQLQSKAGEKPAAAQTIDRFLTVSDKSEYAYLRAARLLEQLEMAAPAKEKYAALVTAFPDSTAAKEAQAAFLYKIGDKDPALAIWRGLADGADAQQLVRLARLLASRNEHALAYELLEKRQAEFASNWLFLGQLISEALANKKYDEAIPWALARVDASESTSELNDAIAQAATVIERAEKVTDILAELQSSERKSLRTACIVAELLEISTDFQQADAALAPWIEKGESLAVMQQVRLATRRYDWTAAAGSMRRLIDLPGERKSENVRRLIEFYERDFRLNDALGWVAEWKKLSPGSTSPWLAESRLQLLSGEEAAALETLRQAAKEFDGNEEIRMQLAQMYGNLGKYADAARIYWLQFEAAETLSDKLRYVELLARLAEQQGNVAQLVENFEERRRSNRQSVEPLLALATIHRVANNYESRRQALAEASKMKPEDLELLHEIARIEEQEGDWERARTTLEGALELDKTNRTRQRLARLHIQYGDPDVGFAMLYQLAGGEQSDPRDIESVADAMMGAGDWQRAKALLATHAEQHPDDYRLRYLLAIAHEEEDEQASAIEEFLTALRAEKEIQGLKSTGQFGMFFPSNYLAQMAEMLPKEAIDIIQFQQGRYSAYSYRQQRGGYVVYTGPYGGLGRGTGPRIPLPGNLEQARQYALMHLLSIAQTLDEKEQQQLLSRLHGAGVANAELLLAVTPADIQTQISANEMLEKFPENEAVRAVVLMRFSGDTGELTPEFFRGSFAQFEKTRPSLALIAAIQGGTRHEELRDMLDGLAGLLDRLEKPNSMLVMHICSYLGRMNSPGQTSELPEAARKLITAKLIEWYPQVRNQQPYGQHLFMYGSRALRASGDAASFVRLLEDEVARHRGGAANPQQQQMYYGGPQAQFLSLPTFPPTALADFPTAVLQVLTRDSQNNPFGQMIDPTWKNDEVVALLPQVKDPILRILLAVFAEAEEAADKALASLLAEKTPMLDAYLLGAARAAKDEKFEAAIGLLDKARYLPMNRTVRRKVDESLLAIALDQSELLKNNAPLRQAARDAALRLRHGTLQPNERTQLVAALEDLGLEKEAELLEKKSTVAATAAPSAGVLFRGGQAASQDQIRRLIDQGKRDVAAKMLANEALALIRQSASQPGNWSYQIRQVRERIASYGLTEDVLAALDPQDSDNHRKWADFGMLNEALEKTTEAQKSYERAIALRPKEDAYRTRLVFLAAKSDPSAAIALCEGFGKNGVAQVAGEILGRMHEPDEAIDSRMQLGDFALALLKHQSKIKDGDLSWGAAFCEALGGRMHSRNGSIPPLYMPAGATDIYGDRVSKETLRRRQTLHDELCREMLQHPATAEEAFTLLLASREARGEANDELTEIARESLLKLEKPRPGGSLQNQQRGYYSNSGYTVPRRTAAECLIQQCFAKNDWSVLDEEVVPHVQKIGRRDLVDEIADYRALFTCPANEFEDKSESYVRQAKRRIPQHSRYQGREPEQLVCEAWQARKLDFDLQPLVLKFAEQSKREGTSTVAPSYLLRYASRLAENKQPERVVGFYEELATIYLAPREKRAEFIDRNYDRRQVTHNSPNAWIHAFGSILQAGLQDERLLEPTLQFIGEGNVAGIVQNSEHCARQGLTSAIKEREPEAIVAHLDKIGVLSEPATFAARALASTGESGTIYSVVFDTLKASDNAKQDQIKKLLRAREPATFGAQFLLAEWDAKEEGRFAFLQSVVGQFDELQQLDDDQESRLAKALAEFPDNSGQREIPADMEPLLEWIRSRNSDRGRALGEAILKAKRFEDVKTTGHDPADWFAGIFPELLNHDPRLAADAYFKLVTLYEDAMQRNPVGFYFSDVASELLARSARQLDENDLSRTRLLLAVLGHEKAATISFTIGQLDQMSEPLRRKFDALLKEARDKKQPADQAVASYVDWLKVSLKQEYSPALTTAFYRAYRDSNFKPAETAAIEAWLAAKVAETAGDPLPQDLLFALQLLIAKQSREKAQQENGGAPSAARLQPASYHQVGEARIADAALPLPTRMAIAELMFNEESESLPAPSALAINRLATEACKSRVRFDNRHHRIFARNALALLASAEEAAAREYWQAWHDRFGRGRAVATNRYPRDPDESASGDTLAQMLALYLKLSDDEPLNQFLRRHDDSLGKRRETAPLLVNADRPELALRVVRGRGPQVEGNVSPPLVVYDAPLAEKVEKFLPTIENEELRYFVKVWFAALEDPQPRPEGLPSRDERLVALAERLPEVSWKSPELQQKALLMFCSSDPAKNQASSSIESTADKIHLPSMSGNNNSEQFNETVDLVVERLEIAAAKGEIAPLDKFVGQTLAKEPVDDWQLHSAFQRHSEKLAKLTAEHIGKYKVEQLSQLAEVLRQITTPSRNGYIPALSAWNSLSVIAHLKTGQLDKYRAWYESLDEPLRDRLKRESFAQDAWGWLAATFGEQNADNTEARLAAAADLLLLADRLQWLEVRGDLRMKLGSDGSLEKQFPFTKLLSAEELAQSGGMLVDRAPASGATACSLATFHESGNRWREASEFWAKATAAIPTDKQQQRAWSQLWQARALGKAGEQAAAQKLLAGIELKDMPEEFGETYRKVEKELQSPAEADEAKPDQPEPAAEKSEAA